jgi:hypothetical protein
VSPVVHHAIDVDATPETCWRVFVDLATWPSWFPLLKHARGLDGADPWRVGGRLELTFDTGKLAVPIRAVIEELQPAQLARWRGSAFGMTGNHWYRFEATRPGLTRVTTHEDLTGLAARLLPRALLDWVDEEVHRSMGRFKTLVESSARARDAV